MGSIAYKEDIIKEMSSEMGIPYKELEEIINTNISYLKKTITESDNLIINLPNLCKLRLNNRLAYSYVNNNSKSTFNIRKEKVENLKRKLDLFSEYKENNDDWNFLINTKKPLFERLYKKAVKDKYVNRVSKKMYSIIQKLEEETNKIIEKIK